MPNKCNWTMSEAKRWVEDHKGKNLDAILAEYEEHKGVDESEGVIEEINPQPKEVSQQEVADELNYLVKLIESKGMNEDVEQEAWELVREVMRLTGGDMPDDILEKVGAVLNQKNKDRLNQIKSLAQQVLDSAGQEEEPKALVVEPEITLDQIRGIIGKTVTDVIERAQGKI